MVPITMKVLRMCDGDMPVMGKVYDRMYMLGNKVRDIDVDWADEAADLVEERWEYLHSFMHGAGYAFDPEFFDHRQSWDEAITNGVLEMIERICLRDMMLQADDPASARKELTTDSEVVVERVAARERELSLFVKVLGPFTKQKVLMNAKLMEPADWWNQYCKHLPILSRVATSVLAQVVCASSAERNWSIYGRIKHKGRSILDIPKEISLFTAMKPSISATS